RRRDRLCRRDFRPVRARSPGDDLHAGILHLARHDGRERPPELRSAVAQPGFFGQVLARPRAPERERGLRVLSRYIAPLVSLSAPVTQPVGPPTTKSTRKHISLNELSPKVTASWRVFW